MMLKVKVAVYGLAIALIATCLIHIFWEYEVKYALPTPVPADYREVCIGEKVDFSPWIAQQNKPLLLHFFNPNCPCSKFNIKEVVELRNTYGARVDFKVVLQSDQMSDIIKFKDSYGEDMDILPDPHGSISDVFGIYSTPQAVIVDSTGVIYYKGNYNKARFCTNKDSRFVDLAIQHLIAGEELPAFNQLATVPYGCSLPSDTSGLISDNSLYQRIFQP